MKYAFVAQWIEHLTSDQKVGGSSPSGRTTLVGIQENKSVSSTTYEIEGKLGR